MFCAHDISPLLLGLFLTQVHALDGWHETVKINVTVNNDSTYHYGKILLFSQIKKLVFGGIKMMRDKGFD
ncbi:MAG: hypothetical protein ACI8WB_004255 [Phenylobacterium sp.]